MISYLNGKVIKKTEDFIIFVTNFGIGFKVFTPYPDKILNEVFTFQINSEKDNTLYGFKTYEEIEFFEKLLKIPNVGPKTIIQILKNYSVDELNNKIKKGESIYVKGIRKKVLDDIINFLIKENKEVILKDDKIKNLVKILSSLGFEKDEIFSSLKKTNLNSEDSLEESVKKVLKVIKNE